MADKAERIVQTAGRDLLGDFAPEFAHYNDDVLFGENWNNEDLDLKTRSLITVVALMAQGITDSSLKYHIQNAKAHGVSRKEMAAAITHAAFYAGWPKAWAVFNLAKEVYIEPIEERTEKEKYQDTVFFPLGEPNPYGQAPLFNVTFEPGCRNNWHIHHAKRGGGQILICVGGRGYYQEWDGELRELHPGDIVTIPANIKHWHGAAPDSWFSHLAFEVAGEQTSTEWCEAVGKEYPSK